MKFYFSWNETRRETLWLIRKNSPSCFYHFRVLSAILICLSKISIFWMKGATDLNKFVLWGRRETIEEIEKTAGLAIFKYQLLGINIVCLFFAIFAHIIYICCFFSFYYHYLVSSFLYFLFLFLLYFYFTFILFLQRNNL